MNNLNLVLPEIFISLSVMFLLILGVFKKNSSQLTFNLSLVTILVAIILTVNETFSLDRITLFNGSIVIDQMASLMKIITLIGAFLVLGISSTYLKSFKIFKIEYPILILTCLAVPTLFFGFYPEPLFNTIEVSVTDLINMHNLNIASK